MVDASYNEQPHTESVISPVTSVANNNMLYCLFCLLKNRYENIVISDNHLTGGNGGYKIQDAGKDSILKSNINQGMFCDFVCMVNRKCYFPVDVSIPLANNVDASLKSDYSFEIVNYNHYEAFSEKDNRIKTDGIKHEQLKYTLLQPPVSVFSSYDQAFLRKVGEIIESNYTDTMFSVEQLAYNLNLSVSQVNRRLKALTDYPSGHLLRVFRLHHAAGLILSKTALISEICFKSGFNSQPYFSRAFKKQFGYSPSVYRKRVSEKYIFMRQ
jgi:AraC-like DNA-binding protein